MSFASQVVDRAGRDGDLAMDNDVKPRSAMRNRLIEVLLRQEHSENRELSS